MESLDAFRLAKYLRDRGESVQCMDDVLAKYAMPVLLYESGYMVFMMSTVGSDDACVFLTPSIPQRGFPLNRKRGRSFISSAISILTLI